VITSPSNPSIKAIKQLRDRKHRAETGLCLVEGIRIVYEAVLQGAEVHELLVSPELAKSEIIEEIAHKAHLSGVPITGVSKTVFESLSGKDGPQGVAAVVRQHWTELAALEPGTGKWVALHEIADPGNLGTILRTCDATGAVGVILLGNCTDPFDPVAMRASMGAVFSKKIVKATGEQFTYWVKQQKRQLIGTSDRASVDYRTIRYNTDMVLLMGSERQGLPPALEEACEALVAIPMCGVCDSLNLAVATGVMLYESIRAEFNEVRA